MSTSISFAISTPDQDAQTSRSYSDLRKAIDNHSSPQDDGLLVVVQTTNSNQAFERRHTGSDTEAERAFFELGPSKLKRWRDHDDQQHESPSESRSMESKDEILLGEEFYEEVDERMSRNSLEYPEHQAKYIDRWLNEINSIKSKSFDACGADQDSSCPIRGNVIGIRGFSSENSIVANNQWRDELKRLKCDYLKLQLDNAKLQAQFDEANHKYRKVFKKKENDVSMLKALIRQHGKRSAVDLVTTCNECGSRTSRGQQSMQRLPTTSAELAGDGNMEHQISLRKLELDMQSKDMEFELAIKKLKLQNEALKSDLEEKKTELDNLRNQMRTLSLDPANRQFIHLCNENLRLKDLNEMECVEFQLLRDNYAKLESQLRSLIEDQKSLSDEKDAELRQIMVELCRLQVYQPKLEMTLDTERKIKFELQARIESLQEENEQLEERSKKLEQELHRERCRSGAIESNELDRLHDELAKWQDKSHRLAKDKSDLEELLRNSMVKVSSIDNKFQNEINQLREAGQLELENANGTIRRLDMENKSLALRLDQLSHALEQSELEKHQVDDELSAVRGRLELETIKKQDEQQVRLNLKQVEEKADSLRNRLQAAEANNMQLVNELQESRSQLEASTQQLSDLKRRFDLQLKSFDELKQRRDKELARLRADLNYEQYNRQVALKGVERELRASLKELETMKCRFSTRLRAQSDTTDGNKE